MTQQDYDQQRRECWEEFKRENLDGEVQWQPVSRYDVFCAAFDRAYALGREKETITREEIEKAAEKYSQSLGKSRDVTWNDGEYGFIAGANFALGKKIGISDFYDAEDTVISGWVCRDNNSLNAQVLIGDKPKRTGFNYWENKSADCITLPKDLFPDLAWDDDPQEVEIILKRKKNG